MTALRLACIDSNGQFSPTDEDMARLIAFLLDDAAVIAAVNEEAADDDRRSAGGDRPAVNEAPWSDDWSMPGYDYLGTRCIISGGDVLEIGGTKEDTDTDTELPF